MPSFQGEENLNRKNAPSPLGNRINKPLRPQPLILISLNVHFNTQSDPASGTQVNILVQVVPGRAGVRVAGLLRGGPAPHGAGRAAGRRAPRGHRGRRGLHVGRDGGRQERC